MKWTIPTFIALCSSDFTRASCGSAYRRGRIAPGQYQDIGWAVNHEAPMKVRLAYGERGLTVDLPDRNLTIVEPRFGPAVADERQAVVDALRRPIEAPPLRAIAGPTD